MKVATVRLLQEEIKFCYRHEGTNHYQNCRELTHKYRQMIKVGFAAAAVSFPGPPFGLSLPPFIFMPALRTLTSTGTSHHLLERQRRTYMPLLRSEILLFPLSRLHLRLTREREDLPISRQEPTLLFTIRFTLAAPPWPPRMRTST